MVVSIVKTCSCCPVCYFVTLFWGDITLFWDENLFLFTFVYFQVFDTPPSPSFPGTVCISRTHYLNSSPTTLMLTAMALSVLGEAVRVEGVSLYSPLLNMRIVSECTAITPKMVFVAAFEAFPSSVSVRIGPYHTDGP